MGPPRDPAGQRRRRVLPVILAAAAWLGAAGARAHDTWLIPDEAELAAPAPLSLTLASGIVFPLAEAGTLPERLAVARFRLAGRVHPLQLPRATPTALRLRMVPGAAAGLAAAWVTLKPFEVDIEDDIVQVYFDEINASAGQRALWARAGPARRWQERYVKHAKTFLRLGAADGSAADWAHPVGAAYEIVPLADPTRLRVGDSLALRVLKGGRPLAGLQLGAVHDGAQRGGFVASDAAGGARVSFDRAGWWLIRGTELRAVDATGMNWESDWVSLSVFVAAR